MRKGEKMSDEQRRKISISHKGKKKPWAGKGFKGQNHSLESRKKIGEGIKNYFVLHPDSRKHPVGEKHWNWRGGTTPKHEKIRHSFEYKLWRKAVFERDKYTCIWCGDCRGGNLNADHIKPFARYPELRFAIDNGRTLCEACHKTTDTWGRKTKSL